MPAFFLRSSSMAFSISPLAAIRAALQSIMGALVRSRRLFTAAAEIVLMLLIPLFAVVQGPWSGERHHSPLASLFNDCWGGSRVRGGCVGAIGRRCGGDRPRAQLRLLLGRQRRPPFQHGIGQLGKHQLDGADTVV